MLKRIGKLFGGKTAAASPAPVRSQPIAYSPVPGKDTAAKKPSYTKIFRWRMPKEQPVEPATVEIVGTFTRWQKVPLVRESRLDAWQATIHEIAAHKTHHYMLLVDGCPSRDENSDGLAIPQGPEEEQYQLMTERGPRLFMLFAQAK